MATNVTEQSSSLAAGRICPQCNERMESRRCANCNVDTARLTALASEDDTHKLIGQTIADRYRISGVLGRGGMGTVYRGIQIGIDRPVAVKVMSREISTDLESIKRFQREAKLTSRLTHPNTIRVYDFGMTDDDHLYLVMELLEGRELGQELDNSPTIAAHRAVAIAIQILRALREAHQRDIVHRDLKPDNVFLRDVPGEGEVIKVMDFGIAKSVRGDVSQVTSTGTLIGTPAYMSPEQARGEPLDGRSDIYTVGTMLFEMVCGQLPFPVQEGDTAVQVLIAKITRKPPTLASIAPDVPDVDALSEIIERFLKVSRGDRPRDADAAIAALESWQKRDQTIITPAVAPPPERRPSRAVSRRRAVNENARTVASTPRPRKSSRRAPAARPRPAPTAPASAAKGVGEPSATVISQAPPPASPVSPPPQSVSNQPEPETVQYDTRSGQQVGPSASGVHAAAAAPSRGISGGLAVAVGALLAVVAVGAAFYLARQDRQPAADSSAAASAADTEAADPAAAKAPAKKPAADTPAAEAPAADEPVAKNAVGTQSPSAVAASDNAEDVDAGSSTGAADVGAAAASASASASASGASIDAGADPAAKPVKRRAKTRKVRRKKKANKADKRDEFRMVD